MYKENIYKKFIKYLYMAQVASDSGKGIFELNCHDEEEREAARLGYKAKDLYLIKALRLCIKYKICLYSISIDTTYNKKIYIIYFHDKNGKRKRQYSFHTYNIKEIERFPKGVPCHWEQNDGITGHVRMSLYNAYKEVF